MAAWQGLGYNRRALALQRTPGVSVAEFDGRLPDSVETLRTFPGIGEATAGALGRLRLQPAGGVHRDQHPPGLCPCFFPEQSGVRNRELLPLVDQTLDRKQPRPWYYALMDYGAMLHRPPQSQPQERPPPAAGPFCRSRPPDPGPDPQDPPQNPRLSRWGNWLGRGKNPARTTGLIHTLIKEGFLE